MRLPYENVRIANRLLGRSCHNAIPLAHQESEPMNEPSAARQTFSSNRANRGRNPWHWASSRLEVIPPPVMVLLSILALQMGSANAKTLLTQLSTPSVVLMRTGFAAIVLWIVARPQVRHYSKSQWAHAALLGVVTALMNLAFYASIARIPLGVAVTIEFLGPFAVSLAGSRKAIDFLWPILAFGGILLDTPTGALRSLSSTGIAFALAAAVGWAGYILVTARTSAMFSGTTGLGLAMSFAAMVTLPVAIPHGAELLNFPWPPAGNSITPHHAVLLNFPLAARGFAVAMLSTTIPFSLEFLVLKKMSPRTFGVLLSAEPAVAALIGLVVLQERLGVREWLSLLLVSIATLGVTVAKKKPEKTTMDAADLVQ